MYVTLEYPYPAGKWGYVLERCAQYFALRARTGADHFTYTLHFLSTKPNVDNGQIQLHFLEIFLPPSPCGPFTLYVYRSIFKILVDRPQKLLQIYKRPESRGRARDEAFPLLEPCDLR